MLPMPGDFIAEMRTRKHGTLTYTASSRDAEDVTLFERASRRNIAAYASAARLAARGRFYSEDDDAEYHGAVVRHRLGVRACPAVAGGRTHMRLRVAPRRSPARCSGLPNRSAVSSVSRGEYGRLLAVRVRGQNSLVVSLPAPVRGLGMTLDVGCTREPRRRSPSSRKRSASPAAAGRAAGRSGSRRVSCIATRATGTRRRRADGYATATLRVRVPQKFGCVASGELVEARRSRAPRRKRRAARSSRSSRRGRRATSRASSRRS